jgi:AraC-like DNA-binding protein
MSASSGSSASIPTFQSISAIAFAAGFSDLSHFNRAFRQHFGETPTEARRVN